jgi:transposase
MADPSTKPRAMPVARRALIVQRVLVDGWTSAKAAATFGVSERLVADWVADYRRYGMASLRHAPSKLLGAEVVRLTILRPIRRAASGIANALRRHFVRARIPRPVLLRQSNDERRGRG